MKLQLYEGMYILNPDLGDEGPNQAMNWLQNEIDNRGGTTVRSYRIGLRKLAYEIQKKKEGYYFLLYFQLPPNELSSLDSSIKLNPAFLRCLVLRAKKAREDLSGLGIAEQVEEEMEVEETKVEEAKSEEKGKEEETSGGD